MIEQSVKQGAATTSTGALDVQLAVDIGETPGCPLRDRELDDVRQSVTRSGLGDQPTCQVAISDADGGGYERTPVCDTCPCLVFDAHDCICDVEHAAGGKVLYSAVVPSRDVLRSLISDLRALGTNVSLERIRTGRAETDEASDTVALTDKQREVLQLAIQSGYYDRPRETTLAELADELEVTASAVSQRLNAVERKLVCERARELDHQ